MSNFVDVKDVERRMGRPPRSDAEKAQWEDWIEDAESAARVRIFDLEGYVQEEAKAKVLRQVLSAAVKRKASNPEGKKDERIDDYSFGLVSEQVRVDVFITDDEWVRLIPALASNALTINASGGRSQAPRRRGWWSR